jgi:hypothetical protein
VIITGKRKRLDSDQLQLEDWIRAPVSLNSGSECWVSVDPSSALGASSFGEIVCSPFPPSVWHDIWRIEIETEDKIGNLARILPILHENKIQILSSEGSINTNGDLHQMEFIVEATDYVSISDRDSEFRARSDEAQLVEIYDEIAVKLIDQMNFRADGSPKLKVRRIDAYYNISKHIRSKLLSIPENVKIGIDGIVKLPSAIIDQLQNTIFNEQSDFSRDAYYSASVDTKDRIIRCLIFTESENPLCHIQITMEHDRNIINRVFSTIAGKEKNSKGRDMDDIAGNIVRYQLRIGAPSRPNFNRASDRYCRLDLILSPVRPWRDLADFKEIVSDRLRSLGRSSGHMIEVTQWQSVSLGFEGTPSESK